MSFRTGTGLHQAQRSAILLLLRTIFIHGVVVSNYVHLRWTRKERHTNYKLELVRLVIFTLMPTLLWAEVLFNIARTLWLFISSDPDSLSLRGVVIDWRRYVCGLAGMCVVSTPSNSEESTGLLTDDNLESSLEGKPATTHYDKLGNCTTIKLASIHDVSGLTQHKRKSFQAEIRIGVLLLLILHAVGTIILFARRLDYYDLQSIDKRNFVAAISSILSSVSAILIVISNCEWSTHLLPASPPQPTHEKSRLLTEFLVAGLLNEVPFLDLGQSIVPTSWAGLIIWLFSPLGVVVLVIILMAIWFWTFLNRDQIKQRLNINWHIVLGLPLLIITIWTGFDVVFYFIWDILTLCWTQHWNQAWDLDTWSLYLPIC